MHFLVVSLSCLVCTLSPQARGCADGWNCLVVGPPLAVFYSQVGTHTAKQNKIKKREDSNNHQEKLHREAVEYYISKTSYRGGEKKANKQVKILLTVKRCL